jgi:hypothetical protein
MAATNIFGNITNPFNTISPGSAYAGGVGPNFGLIIFLNNMLRLVFVVAGLFAFVQLLLAGFQFINAGGDQKQIEQAWNKIWQSVVGLMIMVISFGLAAIIGVLLLGDATAILTPKIYGPK